MDVWLIDDDRNVCFRWNQSLTVSVFAYMKVAPKHRYINEEVDVWEYADQIPPTLEQVIGDCKIYLGDNE